MKPSVARSRSLPRRLPTMSLCALLLFAACQNDKAPAELPAEPPAAATLEVAASPTTTSVQSEPDDEAALVFDQSALHTFDLQLSEEDLALLDADPMAEQYVPGTLTFDGKEYGPVGIRYKGSFGAWVLCTENSTAASPLTPGGAKTCPKLNIKVSFNWSDPDQKFFGLKKLQFHAMNSDPSLMRERLGYKMFRDMGAAAPRATHARVRINGVLSGLYINVEAVDGRFTRSRFEDGKGNLYKEAWPTTSSQHGDVSSATLLSALRSNRDEDPSAQAMLDFGQAVESTSGAERSAVISEWMDVANTMRMVAVDRTIRADDGPFHFYCGTGGCGNHNFFVYEQAESRGMWVIPWDLDTSFTVLRDSVSGPDRVVKVMDEWNDHSVTCEPRAGIVGTQLPPSCDPLVHGWAAFQDVYDSGVQELLAGPFGKPNVDDLLLQWTAQISETVSSLSTAEPAQLSTQQWQEGMTDLQERIAILRNAAALRIPPVDPDFEAVPVAVAPFAASCGAVTCLTNQWDNPTCCTSEGTSVPGDPDEFTGLAPNLCGVDIGAEVPERAGFCIQLNQPGEPDAACPEAEDGHAGCCTEEGFCGHVSGSHGLGCMYMAGAPGKGPPCGAGLGADAGQPVMDAGATPETEATGPDGGL